MLAGELVFKTIRDLFADHVYPDFLPPDVTDRPAAVYQYISGNAVNTLDCGYTGTSQVRIQIDVYSTNFKEAKQKADAVSAALGTPGLCLPVLFIGLRNLTESETRQARISLDFSIWEQTKND